MQTKQFIIALASDKSHRAMIEIINAENVAGKSFTMGEQGEDSRVAFLLALLAKKSISAHAAIAEPIANPTAPK